MASDHHCTEYKQSGSNTSIRIEKWKQHCLYLQIREFNKLARDKIYVQKSLEILYNSNNQVEKKNRKRSYLQYQNIKICRKSWNK